MKRYTLHTLVPALALLAVGCSTPTAMQSTEYDDMYYTSSDKTEYIQPEAVAQANEEEYETEEAVTEGGVINPEYTDESSVRYNYEGDEYYDGRTYDPRDNWYRPRYSYVDPYWGSAYIPAYSSRYQVIVRDPFYDPFFYDPFYDPYFYDPYYGRYSVSIAFRSGWGNPYFTNPYGRYYYSSWYPYNNYYNGFYQGYQYGRNQYIYDRPGYVQTRQVQYGPRSERSRIVTTGNPENGGRPERGSLSSGNEQQVVTPGTNDTERTTRIRGTRTRTTESGKRVITTRPDVRRTRTERVTPPAEQNRTEPVERTRRTRTRGEYVPAPAETREQPARQETRPAQRERRERVMPVRRETRQETRSTERRERPAPVRQAPTRSSYERSEVRPAPVRSNSSSSSSSGSRSSESRSGGRPTRGN